MLGIWTFRLLAKPAGLLGQLDVHYVVIDLKDSRYRAAPALAATPERRESLTSMVARLQPHAAITGTYYDEHNRPLGDLVIDGREVCRGSQRQGIGFTFGGRIKFVERMGNRRIDWTGCRGGLAAGPRLVRSGEKDINVERDGFSPRAAGVRAWRCAVGATKEGKLIMCAVKDDITLSTLGEVMLELGAQDAINLDGGGMCALYESGRYHARPLSRMNNLLVVYKRK
mgnify:CR=1 FL=1